MYEKALLVSVSNLFLTCFLCVFLSNTIYRLLSKFRRSNQHLLGQSRVILHDIGDFLFIIWLENTYTLASGVVLRGIISNLTLTILEGRMTEKNKNIVGCIKENDDTQHNVVPSIDGEKNCSQATLQSKRNTYKTRYNERPI